MQPEFTLRFILISLFAAMGIVMNAESIIYSTDDGFKYYLDTETKTAKLAKYSGSTKEVIIPENVTYEGFTYNVTKLGGGCFFGCSALTSITVDDNNPLYDSRENCNAIIKTESNTMVSGCMNTILPSSVTSLEDGCFWGCSSLTSITIPTSVTSLGESSFGYCITSIVGKVCCYLCGIGISRACQQTHDTNKKEFFHNFSV